MYKNRTISTLFTDYLIDQEKSFQTNLGLYMSDASRSVLAICFYRRQDIIASSCEVTARWRDVVIFAGEATSADKRCV
jgi:hypothetical protein